MTGNSIGAREGGTGPLLVLWFSVLAGPVAWTIRLAGSYALIAVACDLGVVGPPMLGITVVEWLVLLLTGITALASLVAGIAGWRIWRRAGVGLGVENHGLQGRNGFLGLSGFLLGILFFLVILMEGSAVFFLVVCET